MKAFFLLILLVIFISSSAGRSDGINKNAMKLTSPQEVITKVKVRKLLSTGVDVLDYHGAEANPVHDPGKGKPGGRAANP